MSMLKELYAFNEEGENEQLFYIEEFYKFIKDRVTSNDRIKFDRTNFLREFRGHKTGIISLSHGKALTISSLVRYIFNHFDDYRICHDIGLDISNSVLSTKAKAQETSVLSLYVAISKLDIKQITSMLMDKLTEDAVMSIPSIDARYKTNFTATQWMQICLFENHYSQYVRVEDEVFETELRKKWDTFNYFKNMVKTSKNIEKISKQIIKQRSIRQKVFDKSQNIEIWTKQRHNPEVIESQLQKRIDFIYPNTTSAVICVDIDHSIESNSVIIIIVSDQTEQFKDQERIVVNHMRTRHTTNVAELIFLSSNSLEHYERPGNEIARFHLRDDIFQGKLQSSILGVVRPEKQVFLIENNTCDACYDVELTKPLSLQTFSLLQEWFFDVPLDLQILLERFINRESFYRTNEKNAFLVSKLERLYGIYDILLNTYNRNHVGILQQANTDELAMHYQSITTVFSIASSTGISSSYVTAEKKIKEKATDDICYYNTFLKRYPLTYVSIEGIGERQVNLRECHLIFMMDNLVRLTYRTDPNPGESRTGQVCTLPLTLQGLPKDNAITLQWHTDDCSRERNCQCKKPVQLQKDDFERVLVSLSKDEEVCWQRLQKLLTWGHVDLWKKFKTTNLVFQNPEELDRGDQSWSGDESLSELFDVEESFEEYKEETVQQQTLFGADHLYTVEPISMTPEQQSDFSDGDDEEENLDSLIQTANFFYQANALLLNDNNVSGIVHMDYEESDLEDSFSQMNLSNETLEPPLHMNSSNISGESSVNIMKNFGFEKFVVPPLLCRHPPPATGRDDDLFKLREILDDILVKCTQVKRSSEGCDRILFGPDNKIGANFLQLKSQDKKYSQFLAEFPLLHLRKSKINTLFSAYKDAGLLQLLMFMCDDNKKDWAKLISFEHIDEATKYVRRLSVAFHVAFLSRFLQCIDDEVAKSILTQLEKGNINEVEQKNNTEFQVFLRAGCAANATFALHVEMMRHCDEVVAVYLSERLGGGDGYDLLLGAVKSSLLFSFLNGATSYGPFCARLLIEHYSAGHFHQCMKRTLYATPIGNSTVNFASDAKREMDHQDAMRGFRSGSTLKSVTSRMSLIDSLNETHQRRTADREKNYGTPRNQTNRSDIEWKLSEVDLNHIIPTSSLILRRGGLSLEENDIPQNVYDVKELYLPSAILDQISFGVGKYLLKRFLAINELLGMTSEDVPDIQDYTGPQQLLSRAKRSKGITLKRTTEKAVIPAKTEREIKEEKRKKVLKKEIQMADLLSSEMNMCQSLVKPDCSKPKVMKSRGIQDALISLLQGIDTSSKDIIALNSNSIPNNVSSTIQMVTIEFAGVKFKANVCNGTQYIKYIQNAIVKQLLQQLPKLERIVLCEEKYSFTPDTLKAATHKQRQQKQKVTIAHLRNPESSVNATTFRKDDIITTREGKTFISQYFAANAKNLSIEADFILDIDSEFVMQSVPCNHGIQCNCENYTTPLRCTFKKSLPSPRIENLNTVSQRKGEAEMSQVDWLIDVRASLSPAMSACSILTSGDIDAIPIHLYALSKNWPQRNAKYVNPVYVVLQKQKKKVDVYNITSLMEIIETFYCNEEDIVKKIAVVLCMGGNDFIPKFYNISHKKMLQLFMKNDHFRKNLFVKIDDIYHLDKAVYKDFVKTLFCPRSTNADLSYEDIRKLTIYGKTARKSGTETLRNVKSWLPPESALDRMADLIDLQILYLETAGHPMAKLPNFLQKDCLKMTDSGETEYYFGPDAQENVDHLKRPHKRQMVETPQKGMRRKRMVTSTPSKSKK